LLVLDALGQPELRYEAATRWMPFDQSPSVMVPAPNPLVIA
jgi:hypothetical protein